MRKIPKESKLPDINSKQFSRLPHCRVCKNKKLIKIISLGNSPPANSFLSQKQLKDDIEPFFPLQVNYCPICRQLQLSHVVSPNLLFKDYVYVSSTSSVFIKHFQDYAKSIFKKLKLKRGDLAIDIGSNDGILLKPLKSLGLKVLGIDPAIKIAKTATENGIETLPNFLNQNLAEKIAKKYGPAKVITANNVFAHINNIDEIALAAKILLIDDGVLIIEAPYLVVFLQKNLFDTIYHEHLSYFSLKPLNIFFKRHNMRVFDVEQTSSHGGSIRVFLCKEKSKFKVKNSVSGMLKSEEKLGLDQLETYQKFSQRIKDNKKSLNELLMKLKKDNKKIIGFGAPAKGNTLLNYFKIGTETLDYIVDDSEYKQNLFTPGTHIPVLSPQRIAQDKPDYILILAWNFAEPIMKRFSEYKKSGGNFIVPVPQPKIV